MKVHTDLSKLPVFKNAVVTIGTFDGVHTGHQQIINQLKEEAAAVNGETVIITFHPHPRKVVSSGKVLILTTLKEKTGLLRDKGIDHLVVVPFDQYFAEQSAEGYVHDFLYEKFHPHTVIIGYDHRFGKDRQGDYHLMEDYAKKYGFALKEIPGHVLDNAAVSSTRIREALLQSNVDDADKYLGYPYFFEGTVIEGNKLGRALGFPTANIQMEDPEKLVPGNGVYVVDVALTQTGEKFHGMMNIGVRPTVEGTKRVIEVNIFDFDREIYGATLKIFVKHYLRSEIKFSGLDALKEQLAKDKEAAQKYS